MPLGTTNNVPLCDSGTPLKYSITVARPDKQGAMMYGLGAMLNVGWKATPGGDEWVRQGDYLNDTMHNVEIKPGQDSYHMNVEVMHYT